MSPYAFAMAKWDIGFDGKWQEWFDDRDQAVEWAKEVAETGRTVDVAKRRFLLGRKLVAVFPESALPQREAFWRASAIPWLGGGMFFGSGGDSGGGGGGC